MQIAFFLVVGLYGLLSAIAALSQIKSRPEKKGAPILMLCGCIFLFLAIALQIFLGKFGWLPAFAGSALISAAAYLNGKRSGSFHISHHMIRASLEILLVAGFLFL